ncbi:MAG TPA: GNAT family N-acetyltransferase [Anaerolineales bacterium]|nr:GNAT family N-acetyltransferase [Anaerolineales bacterium]
MGKLLFRSAVREDLTSIVHLLADDELGSQREKDENPLPRSYDEAFEQIDLDPNHHLIVAAGNGEVIGTLHLAFLPSISFQGALRAQVESVRVGKGHCNRGVGRQMMEWTIERARQRGAQVLQLTTHRSRKDAQRFYESLGFKSSHLGMKLILK